MERAPAIDDYLKLPAHPLRQMGGTRLAVKKKNEPGRPLVTIYTVVKNQKGTLAQTIASVLNQTYSNIEYIVIDGASVDGTLEVIKQFDDKIDLWISEPDFNASDAFNKAISIAQGDFLFWLSSDDWIDPDFIEIAVKTFLGSGADFVFGNMLIYRDERPASLLAAHKDYARALISGNPRFNFPCAVIKKECFKNIGLFNITYKHTSDYEWFLRLHLRGGKGRCENLLTVHRRTGGYGDSNPIQSKLELLRMLRQFGLPTARAALTYFSQLLRIGVGYLAKLFLPGIIHKKLKMVARRRKQ